MIIFPYSPFIFLLFWGEIATPTTPNTHIYTFVSKDK